eukprot:365693-Chlamydomonas_euryale.AAC.12
MAPTHELLGAARLHQSRQQLGLRVGMKGQFVENTRCPAKSECHHQVGRHPAALCISWRLDVAGKLTYAGTHPGRKLAGQLPSRYQASAAHSLQIYVPPTHRRQNALLPERTIIGTLLLLSMDLTLNFGACP